MEKPYAKEDFSVYGQIYKLKTERNTHTTQSDPMKHEIVVLFIPSYSHSSHPSSTLFPHTQRKSTCIVPFVCSFLYSSSIFYYTQYVFLYNTYILLLRHISHNTPSPHVLHGKFSGKIICIALKWHQIDWKFTESNERKNDKNAASAISK